MTTGTKRKDNNIVSLRYSLRGSPNEHPQKVMQDLGITYRYSEPKVIADQWWFIDCKNVIHPLPAYLNFIETEEHK